MEGDGAAVKEEPGSRGRPHHHTTAFPPIKRREPPPPLLHNNMVLLWMADADTSAGPNPVTYDGSNGSDVSKFLFVYDNIIMRGKADEEKAGAILCPLEGAAFDYYYDKYSHNGSLTEAASDCDGVKSALSDRFTETPRPEENIQKAMICRLDGRNLLASMVEIDKLYKKAGFNDEAKYGLLRNAVVAHLDVAQFAIYRSPTTYEELMKTVKDFADGRDAFKAAKSSAQSAEPVAPKRVLMRSDRDPRQDKLENKVDALTSQLAELSLMMKKRQTPGESDTRWTCSCCKEPGDSATRCRSNPHRDSRFPTCGKIGHTTESCWSRSSRINVASTRPQNNSGAGNAYGPKPGSSANDAGGEARRNSKQFTFITESTKGGVVAATKRSAKGEALPKQSKNPEEVAILRLLNSAPVVPRGTLAWNEPLRVPRVKPARQRKKNVSKKAALQEHVQRRVRAGECTVWSHLWTTYSSRRRRGKEGDEAPSIQKIGALSRICWTYGCLPETSSCDYCSSLWNRFSSTTGFGCSAEHHVAVPHEEAFSDAREHEESHHCGRWEELPVCWITAPSPRLVWGTCEQDGLPC